MDKTNQLDLSFYKITGDPFVDLGSLVLETITERFDNKNILEIIEFVIDIYINKWHQKLHSIFHTNSKILNPSTKGQHAQNTLNYYRSILEKDNIIGCLNDSYCKICGQYGMLYQNSREFFPNTGSGAFVNFHHGHESGIYLCNICTIKLFFIPLGVVLLGGKNGFLHSQSDYIRKFWKKRIINENLDKISKNLSDGILRTEYSRPENALFHMAEEVIREVSIDDYAELLQLFNFTNFGASPDCVIYTMPNPVFSFLNKMIRYFNKPWNQFVNRYYRIKGAKWNTDEQYWTMDIKKHLEVLKESEYINNPNEIYQKLLNNQSILPYLLRIQKNYFYNRLEKFPIEISQHYIMEVLNMTKEQVGVIARIADVIFDLSRKDNNYKKYLFMLESAGKAHQLRGALLKIIKSNFHSGAKEPLIRMDDYINYLFPDGQYWGEIRDVLLIHLYEKLHDEGVNREIFSNEDSIEIAETEPVNQI